MLTQGDASGNPCLLEQARAWVKQEFDKPGEAFLGLVHRLDRPVAGTVLFARTSKAAARLSLQFRERTIQKIYLAAVHKPVVPESGTLTHYLKKGRSLKATVFPREAPGAQFAELDYRVVESLPTGSVLEVRPKTGRFHQIRAQLAFIKHPIVGDVKYGAPAPLPENNIALFAQKLIFQHPVSKEELSVEAPVPEGWPFLPDDGPGNFLV